MEYNKTMLKKIGNAIVKELNKHGELSGENIYEVSKKLNYDYDCYGDDYWYYYINNDEEDINYKGRVVKSALDIDDELLSWLEGYKVKDNSIYFTVDKASNQLSCYIEVEMWFKYPTYNCDKEILLFEIDL